MIKVKICGITNLEDALVCAKEGADALGFIFSKKSPRFLNEKDAKKLISSLEPFVTKVGVFIDTEKEKVLTLAEGLGLDTLQFHGNESPAYCNFFKPKFKVIKVFFPHQRPFKESIARYAVDAYAFDIKYEDKLRGERGLAKDILKEITSLIKGGCRVIISGGLSVKNISAITKLKPYAVDVASGLEEFVGKKDKELVRLFIKKVKGHAS
jgi:phosphoribosylanthranilate isomerase